MGRDVTLLQLSVYVAIWTAASGKLTSAIMYLDQIDSYLEKSKASSLWTSAVVSPSLSIYGTQHVSGSLINMIQHY